MWEHKSRCPGLNTLRNIKRRKWKGEELRGKEQVIHGLWGSLWYSKPVTLGLNIFSFLKYQLLAPLHLTVLS